jgi:hypothetical protein
MSGYLGSKSKRPALSDSEQSLGTRRSLVGG